MEKSKLTNSLNIRHTVEMNQRGSLARNMLAYLIKEYRRGQSQCDSLNANNMNWNSAIELYAVVGKTNGLHGIINNIREYTSKVNANKI